MDFSVFSLFAFFQQVIPWGSMDSLLQESQSYDAMSELRNMWFSKIAGVSLDFLLRKCSNTQNKEIRKMNSPKSTRRIQPSSGLCPICLLSPSAPLSWGILKQTPPRHHAIWFLLTLSCKRTPSATWYRSILGFPEGTLTSRETAGCPLNSLLPIFCDISQTSMFCAHRGQGAVEGARLDTQAGSPMAGGGGGDT